MNRLTILTALAATALVSLPATAAVTVFDGNLAGFNAAAGSPPVTIDFDSLSGDINGSTISGVTFSNPSGNTLDVVTAASTFSPPGYGGPTNVLPATTGLKILSPGGSELVAGPDVRQRDSLNLVFASQVKAFGIDILFQSLDCCSYTSYTVWDSGNNVLAQGSVNANGGGAGGAWFIGFASTANDIARVQFDESDDNDQNPDSNIGYDSLRFGAIGGAVPEPSTWAMMMLGFGVIGVAARRRQRVRTRFA